MSTLPGRLSRGLLLFAFVCALTLLFSTYYFTHPPGAETKFQIDSESLVTTKIRSKIGIREDLKTKGGFLYYSKEYHNDPNKTPYTSHSGLQGLVLNTLAKTLHVDGERFIVWARIAFSFLFAVVLVLFAHSFWDKSGAIGFSVVLFLIVASFWLAAFAQNLYWVIFLDFLPFVFAFLVYPAVLEARLSFGSFLIALGALVFLKALCGYEYISNVILGPTAAILYYDLATKQSARGTIQHMAAATLAGVLCFAGAYLVHFAQLSLYTLDLRQAAQALVEKLAIRTWGQNISRCDQGTWLEVLRKYMLEVRAIARLQIPLGWMAAVFLLALPFTVAQAVRLSPGSERPARQAPVSKAPTGSARSIVEKALPREGMRREEWLGLGAACAWALLASMSWAVLAKNHMACHYHINAIVFYLPFGVMLFATLGVIAGQSARQARRLN
jgi:hypothetical protein